MPCGIYIAIQKDQDQNFLYSLLLFYYEFIRLPGIWQIYQKKSASNLGKG